MVPPKEVIVYDTFDFYDALCGTKMPCPSSSFQGKSNNLRPKLCIYGNGYHYHKDAVAIKGFEAWQPSQPLENNENNQKKQKKKNANKNNKPTKHENQIVFKPNNKYSRKRLRQEVPKNFLQPNKGDDQSSP